MESPALRLALFGAIWARIKDEIQTESGGRGLGELKKRRDERRKRKENRLGVLLLQVYFLPCMNLIIILGHDCHCDLDRLTHP